MTKGASVAPARASNAKGRIAIAATWLGLVAYAAAGAPPDDPSLTRALVHGTMTGDFAGVDPAIAAVFSALGVLPLLATSLLGRGASRRRLPLWPFALGTFALGAFALLPYLALRGDPVREAPPPGRVRRALASRALGWVIVAALVALLAWGVGAGSGAAYAHAFRATAMVNVMSIDAVVCTAIVHLLVERARAGGEVTHEPAPARVVRVVPLLGPAVWNACVRRLP